FVAVAHARRPPNQPTTERENIGNFALTCRGVTSAQAGGSGRERRSDVSVVSSGDRPTARRGAPRRASWRAVANLRVALFRVRLLPLGQTSPISRARSTESQAF